MPGIPCQFKVLELTLSKVTGLADLDPIRQAIQAHPHWAYLGAIGPALADFVPGNTAENPYLRIWADVFSLIGDGMRVDKGLLSIVRDFRAFLDEIEPIINAEDLGALGALGEDKLDIVTSVGPDLEAIYIFYAH